MLNLNSVTVLKFSPVLQYGRILDIELKIPPRPPCYCFVEVRLLSIFTYIWFCSSMFDLLMSVLFLVVSPFFGLLIICDFPSLNSLV